MEEGENTTPTFTAAYNESINQLYRINNLWQNCNAYASTGRLLNWKWTLDCVWRELSPDAVRLDKTIEKDEDKWVKKKDKVNKTVGDARNNEALYIALNIKEEFLRMLQDQSGKGTILKDTYEKEFD